MLLTTIVSAVVSAAAHFEDILRGVVVGISDGDTLTILDSANRPTKIRVASIDAPERRQPFYTRSGKNLELAVFGKAIVAECRKKMSFDRHVCKVIHEGEDVGLNQIRVGLAWHAIHFLKEQTPQERSNYANAEADARSRRSGLWIEPNPIPPWEWRRGKRQPRKIGSDRMVETQVPQESRSLKRGARDAHQPIDWSYRPAADILDSGKLGDR